MSSDLLDEITSINSIYGDDTLFPLPSSSFYSLTLPSRPKISLRLEFPPDYPDAPPSILGTQSVGNDIPKGSGVQIATIIRDVLSEIYVPGAPVIFDLIEESGQKLSQLGLNASGTANEEPQNLETHGQESSHQQELYADDAQPVGEDLGPPPPWELSAVVTEKKSVFVARAAPVSSVEEAKLYLGNLLATDKKVAKATHNITAWRIQGGGGVQFQDCDDDGETAAGGRLLHLLELMGSWNVMVVVTRWYGGVQLGPDRFRFINQCGREAVLKVEEERKAREERKEGKGKKKEEVKQLAMSGRSRFRRDL